MTRETTIPVQSHRGQTHAGQAANLPVPVTPGRLQKHLRKGLTLLEVLIGTVILMTAVVLLAQLGQIGRAHSQSADHWSEARRLCLNQLDEMLAGLQPLETVTQRPILEAPHWVYSVKVEPTEYPGLVAVTVTVEPNAELGAGSVRLRRGPARSFSLVRWVQTQTPIEEPTI